jgi:hypothetical protein
MASRYTKGIPEFVYFVGDGEWVQGPFVNPRPNCRRFKLVEVPLDNKPTAMVIDLTTMSKFVDLTPQEKRA